MYVCRLIIEEEAQTAVNWMIDRKSKDVKLSAAMLLTYSIFTIFLLGETSAQLFGRFGFGFPGFSAPEAFEDDPFTDMQERISDLMKGSSKPRKGVKTKIKTEQRGKSASRKILTSKCLEQIYQYHKGISILLFKNPTPVCKRAAFCVYTRFLN